MLFDKVPDPLRPGSKIAYGTYRLFEKFEDLQESWKYQQKLNLQRRSPVGAKAVIVPDLDQLPGEAAARHELAGLIELLAGYSIGEVCLMAGPRRQLRPRRLRRLLRRPLVRRFQFVPLTSYLP